MNIIMKPLGEITPYEKNAKKHDETQINNVAESIRQYGALNVSAFEFDFPQEINSDCLDDNPYNDLTSIPQYDVKGENPFLTECYDTEKTDSLIEEIKSSNVAEDEKQFLMLAAHRHCRFNYRKIAEYYSSASPECQHLMEKSALVIIDYDDAIANGYASLSRKLKEAYDDGE